MEIARSGASANPCDKLLFPGQDGAGWQSCFDTEQLLLAPAGCQQVGEPQWWSCLGQTGRLWSIAHVGASCCWSDLVGSIWLRRPCCSIVPGNRCLMADVGWGVALTRLFWICTCSGQGNKTNPALQRWVIYLIKLLVPSGICRKGHSMDGTGDNQVTLWK